jgi:7,8-dihydropterin-6-yl-methyl-4-(beta-D-ribofuranosyl)aminobenzene 5'-phosphate synthase
MSEEMSRRDFLKVSAAAGVALIAGELVKGAGSTAYGAVKVPEIEKATIIIITDNYFDALRADSKITKRYRGHPKSSIYDSNLHAEHGLACYVETVVDGKPHALMFDFGVDSQGVGRNIGLLGIDFKTLEALVLSHGHFDHWGAMTTLLKAQNEKVPQGIPLYVGEEAFLERFFQSPNALISLEFLNRENIDSLGSVKIVQIKEPVAIIPGAYSSGRIDRVTEYEKIPPMFLVQRGDKKEQDNFIGEQALIMNVRGKGLVVLSGCAHTGIVNAVRHAQKTTGVEKVHAVLGGFHLTGAKPEAIQRTVADIKSIKPDYIAPMHCTGHEAIAAFEREMPEQFILNTAGTKYLFTA